MTSNTLFALRPDSGETLWSFCPYGTEGETIYSSPSAHRDRIYIGDRCGWLHCLSTSSGTSLWKRRTNRARNNDINSTPLVMDGLVVVTTNAKTAVAYDARSGELVWKQQLDGPSTFGPLVHKGLILAVSDSVYLLSRTGKVRHRFSWDQRIQQVESTPRRIVVSFPSKSLWRKADPSREPEPSKMTFLVAKSGKQSTTPFLNFCACIRYSPATSLLYLSHISGVDVYHPGTGTVLYRLEGNHFRNGVAPVDVKDRKIYAFTGDGRVHALRHPQLPGKG
jgi:outer membrane protein assembly factor BamB